MKTVLFVLLIVTMLLTACSGSECNAPPCSGPAPEDTAFIIALAYSPTIQGMYRAATGASGTFVLSNDDILMFVWQEKMHPAFAMIQMSSKTPVGDFALNAGGNGTVADIRSMGELVRHLQDNGWIKVPSGQVPKWIVEALSSQAAWMSLVSVEMMPTFVLIPADMDPMDIINPEIVQ